MCQPLKTLPRRNRHYFLEVSPAVAKAVQGEQVHNREYSTTRINGLNEVVCMTEEFAAENDPAG